MFEHQQFDGVEVSTYKVAKKGNRCSGDSFFIMRTDDYILCAIADGLGSGEEALKSSAAAIGEIKAFHHLDVYALMTRCNDALRNKRGAVVSVLKINNVNQEILYSNVGNIGCVFFYSNGKAVNRLVPSRGFLAGKNQQFQIESIPLEEGMFFVLYTDGFEYVSSFHTVFNEMDSPKEVIHQLIKFKKEEKANDDTTVIIGKIT